MSGRISPIVRERPAVVGAATLEKIIRTLLLPAGGVGWGGGGGWRDRGGCGCYNDLSSSHAHPPAFLAATYDIGERIPKACAA